MPTSHSRGPVPDPRWREHVEALSRSGMTVPAYAEAHGVKADTLYRWRRRARAEDAPTPSTPAAPPRLVAVAVEAAPMCELRWSDGRALRFPASLEANTLRAWVRALERA